MIRLGVFATLVAFASVACTSIPDAPPEDTNGASSAQEAPVLIGCQSTDIECFDFEDGTQIDADSITNGGSVGDGATPYTITVTPSAAGDCQLSSAHAKSGASSLECHDAVATFDTAPDDAAPFDFIFDVYVKAATDGNSGEVTLASFADGDNEDNVFKSSLVMQFDGDGKATAIARGASDKEFTMTLNHWHHVAFHVAATASGAAITLKVDGDLVGTTNGAFKPNTQSLVATFGADNPSGAGNYDVFFDNTAFD